jgi:hypothetical protein
MRERSDLDNIFALAIPPFDAPSFESATAAGFFLRSAFCMTYANVLCDCSREASEIFECRDGVMRICCLLEKAERLISRKNVTFAFSEDYDFIPSLLASVRVAASNQPSPSSDKNWWSTKWCLVVSHIRTHFSNKQDAPGYPHTLPHSGDTP